jgi:hypothetical protein
VTKTICDWCGSEHARTGRAELVVHYIETPPLSRCETETRRWDLCDDCAETLYRLDIPAAAKARRSEPASPAPVIGGEESER